MRIIQASHEINHISARENRKTRKLPLRWFSLDKVVIVFVKATYKTAHEGYQTQPGYHSSNVLALI